MGNKNMTEKTNENQLEFSGFMEEVTPRDVSKNTNNGSPQLTFDNFGIEGKTPSEKKEKTIITRELLETVIKKMKDDDIVDKKSKRNSLPVHDEGNLEVGKMLRIFENGNNVHLKSTIIKFDDDDSFFFFPDGPYDGEGFKINLNKIPRYKGPETRILDVKIFILSLLNKELKQGQ